MRHLDQIQSGDILAWSHRSWRTWYDIRVQLVRLFTVSEYCHVGTAWRVGGHILVIEAVEPRARIYPLSKMGDFYRVGMDAPWKSETEAAALSFVGTEYKKRDAIRAYFDKLPAGRVSECAALVLEIARRDGIDLGTRATPDAVVREALRAGRSLTYITNGK